MVVSAGGLSGCEAMAPSSRRLQVIAWRAEATVSILKCSVVQKTTVSGETTKI